MTNSGQEKLKKVRKAPKPAAQCWNPEKMIDTLMKDKKSVDRNWSETELSSLVDKLMNNYETFGGMDHLEGKDLPSKEAIIEILQDLLAVFFPGYLGKNEITKANIRYFLGNTLASVQTRLTVEIEKSLKYICRKVKECPHDVCRSRAEVVVKELLEKIPELRAIVSGDIEAAYNGDPAAVSTEEVIISYPCLLAITTYRIAHELYLRGIPLIPRIMSEHVHSLTGIDIHPGARIGKNFFIDHGTGVVVGETAEIGDNVKIYQGVTLGALSFPKDEKGAIIRGTKRHPTVGNNVVIYSGATLLGPDAIVGDNVVIGGNVWITSQVAPGTRITIAPPELKYRKNGKC
ncbi:TPA: serine acetyltransferase [Candidatus Bathyarchaeota archaeon]|nr:serine acetyltransferase [Candidatus Bathyarchaeota archaeon]HIJ08031.1 serine acetyltransferase [Candidatus Bathyarchaeota archaeon]